MTTPDQSLSDSFPATAAHSMAGDKQGLAAFASGVWRREDGSVMLPVNLRRASLRDRLYVIGLGWRACRNSDGMIQLCERCIEVDSDGQVTGQSFTPKPDHPEWIAWKLTDESWAQWRAENPEQVAEMEAQSA